MNIGKAGPQLCSRQSTAEAASSEAQHASRVAVRAPARQPRQKRGFSPSRNTKGRNTCLTLGNLKRTQYCGSLRASDADKEVVLMGWVHRRRDLGQLIFIDLRDRAGIAQIVFNNELHPEAHAKAEELRSEFVVAVEGRVIRRQKSNPEIPTGEVEVMATRLHILNNSKTPPFQIEDEVTASEETRLRYRYLDLRRPRPHRNIELRHRVIFEIRKALDETWLLRNRDADAHALDARRRARLSGAEPRPSRAVLRAAAIAANLQADPDDLRHGPLFPDRALLPRRGFARRPPAGIHAARLGDVVPAASRTFSRRSNA